MQNEKEVTMLSNTDELTEGDVLEYRRCHPIKKQVYGKYGSMAKAYLEQYNISKLWSLGGELSDYLHGIDEAANSLQEVLMNSLSKQDEFRMTGNYLLDVKRVNKMNKIIEEVILNQIVYEKV